MNDDVRKIVKRILKDIQVEMEDEFDRNFERQAFFSDLPYAGIHNEGGEIRVTKRMKRYFRAKFYEAQGGFVRKRGTPTRALSDGGFYAWTSKMSLGPEAEFWRFMALKKEGSTITIPRRQFLGTSPEVEQAVRKIVEDNLTEYFNVEYNIKRK